VPGDSREEKSTTPPVRFAGHHVHDIDVGNEPVGLISQPERGGPKEVPADSAISLK
jgi:hypothetical protein